LTQGDSFESDQTKVVAREVVVVMHGWLLNNTVGLPRPIGTNSDVIVL